MYQIDPQNVKILQESKQKILLYRPVPFIWISRKQKLPPWFFFITSLTKSSNNCWHESRTENSSKVQNWKTPYGSCTMLMSSSFFYTKQSGLPEVGIEDRWVIRTFNCRCSMQQLPSKYCNKCTPYCNQRQNNLSIFYRSTRNSTAWECYWPINRGNGSIFSRKLPKRNPLIDRFDRRYVVLPPLEMFSLSVLL